MSASKILDAALLHNILYYNRKSGKLFWKPRTTEMFIDGKQSATKNCAIWNGKYAGKEAFTAKNGRGYFHGNILGFTVVAHRVAWAMEYGAWPEVNVDHIDGDKANNKISNLRHATQSENQMNRPKPSQNSSGVKGVYWCSRDNRWIAKLALNRRSLHIGSFIDLDDAHQAIKSARKRFHGAFAKD